MPCHSHVLEEKVALRRPTGTLQVSSAYREIGRSAHKTLSKQSTLSLYPFATRLCLLERPCPQRKSSHATHAAAQHWGTNIQLTAILERCATLQCLELHLSQPASFAGMARFAPHKRTVTPTAEYEHS